jgi:hypothetical protein
MDSLCGQPLGQLGGFVEHHRLAAGEDGVIAIVAADLSYDLIDAHLRARRPPGCIGRIAPDAAKITSACANKYRRHAKQFAFALQGVKNL